MNKKLAYVIVGFVLLIALIIAASFLNTHNYYLKNNEGALEIWQGSFSPAGKKRMLTLPGIKGPAAVKSVYTQSEVYPYAFRYYINKGDAILSVPGIPDFEDLKSYLRKALQFAVTEEDQNIVKRRLNGIDIMVLLYKADVSASKGSLPDLNIALDYLYEADKIDLEGNQSHVIGPKIKSIKKAISVR